MSRVGIRLSSFALQREVKLLFLLENCHSITTKRASVQTKVTVIKLPILAMLQSKSMWFLLSAKQTFVGFCFIASKVFEILRLILSFCYLKMVDFQQFFL